MKKLVMLLAAGAVSFAFAAEITAIPVSTTEELIAALTQYKSSKYQIQLATSGSPYELTSDDCMEEDDKGTGPSHLLAIKVSIVGMGESPEDVVIRSDSSMRILHANSPVVLANLTLEDGYAQSNSKYARAAFGGGVTGSCTLTNCIVRNCMADDCGGGVRNLTTLYDCEILSCSAKNDGGGAYQPGQMWRCLFKGNSARNGSGGGVYAEITYALHDCTVTNNTAGSLGGGVVRCCLTNCVISGNTAAAGGGYASWSATGAPSLYNCQVFNNRATHSSNGYGGGVMACTMIGGAIYGNYAKHGGGATRYDNRAIYLIGVDVHDNYATGYGGGLYQVVCSNCTVSGCLAGGTGNLAYGGQFYHCDISKTDTSTSVANGCTFHDVGGIFELDNQIYRDLHEGTNAWKEIKAVCRDIPVCTNCLFVNNIMSNYGSRLWFGQSGIDRGLQIINCTIVSNRYGGIVDYVNTNTSPAKIENCAFFGNRYYELDASGNDQFIDISGWNSNTTKTNCLWIHNCAYGKSAHLFKGVNLGGFSDGTNYVYGTGDFGADPMFTYAADHPYEPKLKSPLRGRGLVSQSGMATYDFRGDADGGKYLRLRDGLCDIGCYQCWLTPLPLQLILR